MVFARMRMSLFILVIAVVGLVTTACGGGGTPKSAEKPSTTPPAQQQPAEQKAPQQTITLKVADSYPTTNQISTDGAVYFNKRVEELTGGQVKIEYYPAEQLGKAKDLFDLVQMGTADIAVISPMYMEGKQALAEVATLAGNPGDAVAKSLALLEITNGFLFDKEYGPQGIRPVWGFVAPPGELQSLKKSIRVLDDVKGLKLRVPGGLFNMTAEALGAIPVSVPAPEMYEALQRGTVDATMLPPHSVKPYHVDEVAKYSTVGANLNSVMGLYVINEKVWQKLPKEVQEAITTAGEETTSHLAKAFVNSVNIQLDALEKGGMVLNRLNDSETEQWTTAAGTVSDKWAKGLDSKGKPGSETLAVFKELVKKY